MSKVVDGAALASCFKVVSSFASEIEAMSDSLVNLFTEAISEKNSKLPCALSDKRFSYDDCADDSGWVCTDIAYSLPLKNIDKRSKKTLAYLGFQISMTGMGIAAPGNHEPLVHVFLWEVPVDFNESYMEFPLENDDEIQVCDELLIEWISEEKSDKWSDRQWLFSLRLTSLNSSEDLKRCIVEPALALLRGDSVLSALPSSIEGLIRYTDKQQLFSEVES